MEFTVEFYVSRSGQIPVQEFLEELKQSDPDDHAAVMRGLAKLRDRRYHRDRSRNRSAAVCSNYATSGN
jgi:hypothetical protein